MRNLLMANSGRNMYFLLSSNKHLLDIHFVLLTVITLPLVTTRNGDGKFQS